MAGNAINAKREALDVRELSSGELDAVSGGFLNSLLGGFIKGAAKGAGEGTGAGAGGQSDPVQQFQQILQQLSQG
jgi:hypothetical protein